MDMDKDIEMDMGMGMGANMDREMDANSRRDKDMDIQRRKYSDVRYPLSDVMSDPALFCLISEILMSGSVRYRSSRISDQVPVYLILRIMEITIKSENFVNIRVSFNFANVSLGMTKIIFLEQLFRQVICQRTFRDTYRLGKSVAGNFYVL
jgi:hypothetical protein